MYITSAGWKNSFAYGKLIEILLNSVIYPDKYMALGGDYKLAILEGAVKEDMVDEMKLNGEPSVSAIKAFTFYQRGKQLKIAC